MRHFADLIGACYAACAQLLIEKLQREIKELKKELAMHDLLVNRAGVTYDPYTPEEQVRMRADHCIEVVAHLSALACVLQLAIKQTVVKYARNEVSDIEVLA
jgi:hypothetical protein